MKIKNLLMLTIILFIGILVVNHNVYAEDTTGEETTEEFKWTDTSKSEITLEKKWGSIVEFKINNVENITKITDYKFIITSTNERPEVDSEKFEIMSCDKEKKILSGICTSYIELNQDLYLWVYQYKEREYKYIVEGKKIERKPEGINIFSNTFITDSTTQISFNVPWDINTIRNINVKIGKISDENILRDLKNNSNDAWKQLLNYAKESQAIYNQKFMSDVGGIDDSSKIDLNGLLEDKAYYYLYTEFDDENGKYYPVEGLTFGIADVNSSSMVQPWALDFYGGNEFQWILNEGDVNAETTPSKKEDDSTVVNKAKLPNTGVQITIIGIIAIITGFAIVFKFKYKKYNGIK